MRSVLEFALFAWVGISVVAVLVQLVRIARYKRATATSPAPAAEATKPEAATINLDQRLATPATGEAGAVDASPPEAMSGAANSERMATPGPAAATPSVSMKNSPTAPPAPTPPPAAPMAPPVESGPIGDAAGPKASPAVASPAVAPITETTTTDPAQAAPAEQAAEPTLADLLAGVRLPWNLLPTVDQSREPSNDRVVLITGEGDPGDIGVDVADELERLGFTIAPRGDDTAVATRGDDSLGLQIIEDPMAAEIDGIRRFPTATESSVALDIWIE